MKTVTCNLCNSAARRVGYSKPAARCFTDECFTVVECLDCGLGFVNPQPTPAEIIRYYSLESYGYDDLEPGYHQRRYQIEAEFVRDQLPDGAGKLLLDIGCANGNFPRPMRKLGWEVEGVELSPSSKTICDFKVYHEEFPKIPINEPRYDAVTAWAVLEHVHDPLAHFQKVAAVLKAGGIFVFLVRNFESISSRRLFREDVPRHLCFFTEKTIREYLSRNGLTLVRADYNNSVLSMRPVGWLRYYVCRLTGRELKWRDIPPNRTEYLGRNQLGSSLVSNLRYAALHPFTVVDRLLMPLFERWQILSKKYGIVTYVATKR